MAFSASTKAAASKASALPYYVPITASLTSFTELLQGLLKSHPLSPPGVRPTYSNIAYTLVAYALEAVTSKNYTTLLRSLLTTPLNMTSTFPSPGDDSLAVIPPIDNTWGSPYGDAAPGGGLVSSLSDLSSLLFHILARDPNLGLSSAQIAAWLQPRSFTGSRSSFVGFPWEIFRPEPQVLFPDTYNATSGAGGHSVTIHAKDGAAYGYRARIALLDEYGIGLALLTAGDQNALTVVYDAILSELVPAADAVAKEQVERDYGGVFEGRDGEGVAVRAELTTDDGISLVLSELQRNGTDIKESLLELWRVTLGEFLPSLEMTGVFRLYPIEVYKEGTLEDGRKVVKEDWRMQWEMTLGGESELPGKGISENDCLTWSLGDWLHYGSEPIDRVVFIREKETGEVVGLEFPYLRTGVVVARG